MEHKWKLFFILPLKAKGHLCIMKPSTKTRSWGKTLSTAWELIIASVHNFFSI